MAVSAAQLGAQQDAPHLFDESQFAGLDPTILRHMQSDKACRYALRSLILMVHDRMKGGGDSDDSLQLRFRNNRLDGVKRSREDFQTFKG